MGSELDTPAQARVAANTQADPVRNQSQNVDQMLAQVGTDADATAELIRSNPGLRDPILHALHTRFGNAYVQSVVRALGHPAKESKTAEADEIEVINADCVQEKTALAAAVTTHTSAIALGLARGTATDIRAAARAAADSVARAEGTLESSRSELDAASEDGHKLEIFKTANAGYKALDTAINTQSTVLLNALAVPGMAVSGAPTNDLSMEGAIRARGERTSAEVGHVNELSTQAQTASTYTGAARLAAADQVRADLLKMSAAERAYVIGVMKNNAVAHDILDHFVGKSAELRAAAGTRDFGNGSNASGDSAGQGAFSHGTSIPKLGPDGKPLVMPGTSIKEGKLDTSTGNLGVSAGGKGGTKAGVGGDVRADDGSVRLEGFNGDVGWKTADGVNGGKVGEVTTKVSGGYAQSTSPPSYDGVSWTLSWSVSLSAGGGRGVGGPEDTKAGVGSGADAKLAASLVKSGTTVYPDEAAARKAYEDGAFMIQGEHLASINRLPEQAEAEKLAIGESVDVQFKADLTGGVSGSGSNVNVSANVGVGGSGDVKVTKLANNKLRVTQRGVDTKQASGSVGTIGVSGGGGGGTASSTSQTFDFDLGTPEGKAAYAKFLNLGTPPAAGPGVTLVSSGKGEFSSSTVGIGLGLGPVNGSGSNTSTSGEFTETSTDGNSQRNTIVGQQTDSVKGFNPVTPDKTIRTDSLEITTDSTKDGSGNMVGGDSQFVIKTSIQAQNDAGAANGELDKVLGEPSSSGKVDGKSSGTTGKWSVEGSYTNEQMKKFQDDVVSGKITLTSHGTEATNPAATLKAKLSDPTLSDHDKKVALAEWFAARGPEASADLRTSLGPPQLNVALDGDKYLNGATNKAVFEGKRQALEDRFLDPDLHGTKVKDLLRDVQALYVEQVERRDHIANPDNYRELPVGLRHELVKQVEGNYQVVAQMRARVAARCGEENIGDPSANKQVSQKMGVVDRTRKIAQEERGKAVDARAKHTGALDANRGVSPRQELDHYYGPGGSTAVALYAVSDDQWNKAQLHMEEAQRAERDMFIEDALTEDSQKKAIAAADRSTAAYQHAALAYNACVGELHAIMKSSKDRVNWAGYDTSFYGTRD
ncbi:MAG TPA: hypothetical protein VGM90_23220 [Kofleriaceae bacterium]